MTLSEADFLQQLEAQVDALISAPGAFPVYSANRPIGAYIDHTLLKAEATPQQVAQLCHEARQFGFASVCVNGLYVPQCAELLQGSPVAVCTVVGFPLGATTGESKAFEARQAIGAGASEIDMVLAVGRLKAGDYRYVYQEIAQVVAASHEGRAICKVIIETALLDDRQKVAASLLAVAAGADFVKTSTGFSSGGATVADVALMRRTVGPGIGVKASGGIRTLADAQAMIAAGATRLGASAGVAIVAEETAGSRQDLAEDSSAAY